MAEQIEFKFDTQLLITADGIGDREDELNDYITENFVGDCLLTNGIDDVLKIHFHTNEPWLVLAWAATQGEIYDIVVENMQRQAEGLKG